MLKGMNVWIQIWKNKKKTGYILYCCKSEFTAKRLLSKCESGAKIKKLPAYTEDGFVYTRIPFIRPDDEDLQKEIELKRVENIKEKMLESGISEKDVEFLISYRVDKI